MKRGQDARAEKFGVQQAVGEAAAMRTGRASQAKRMARAGKPDSYPASYYAE